MTHNNTNCLGCGTYLSVAWRHDYGDWCLPCSRKNAEKKGGEKVMFNSPKRTLSEEHKKAISEGRKRAYRKKGKWSAEARARAKERFAAKRDAELLKNTGTLTISQRLEIIESQTKKIREQVQALKSL